MVAVGNLILIILVALVLPAINLLAADAPRPTTAPTATVTEVAPVPTIAPIRAGDWRPVTHAAPEARLVKVHLTHEPNTNHPRAIVITRSNL